MSCGFNNGIGIFDVTVDQLRHLRVQVDQCTAKVLRQYPKSKCMPKQTHGHTTAKTTETNKAWYKEPMTLNISAMSRTSFR